MRVVIAEDSVLLQAGLAKILAASGIEVGAAVGDAESLLAAVAEHQPDAVIADVRMPPTYTDEGIRAALVIRQQWPRVAVLVLSQYVEERYAADLLSANTSSVGYLLKDRVADVAEFVAALRRVAAGGTALDPEVVAQLLVRRKSDPADRLTRGSRRCSRSWPRAGPTATSPRRLWSATARWPSTSTRSSPSSGCPPRTATGACLPYCTSWIVHDWHGVRTGTGDGGPSAARTIARRTGRPRRP